MNYKQYLKQCLGESTDAFRKRWNNYKINTRKFLRRESCMQQYLFEYFQSPRHTCFAEDLCINFIDKIEHFINYQTSRLLETIIKNFSSAWSSYGWMYSVVRVFFVALYRYFLIFLMSGRSDYNFRTWFWY